MCFLKLKKSEHFLIYMVPVIPFLFRKGNAFLFRNDRNEPISCRGLLSFIRSRKRKFLLYLPVGFFIPGAPLNAG